MYAHITGHRGNPEESSEIAINWEGSRLVSKGQSSLMREELFEDSANAPHEEPQAAERNEGSGEGESAADGEC